MGISLTHGRSSVLCMLLALSLSGCGATLMHDENRTTLGSIAGQLDAEQYQQACTAAEQLLVSTASEASTYPVQRYYAAVLLTRAHQEASYGDNQFLKELRRAENILHFGDMEPSKASHLVAVTYYASHGLQWTDAARARMGQPGSGTLVPSALEGFGPEESLLHLRMALLTTYVRLGFEEKVSPFLSVMADAQTLDGCNALIARAQVPAAARPWIHYGLFRFLSTTNQPMAYKFAISARAAAGNSGGTMGPEQVNDILDWIENRSSYYFECDDCEERFDRDLEGCTDGLTDNIDFSAKPKTAAE